MSKRLDAVISDVHYNGVCDIVRHSSINAITKSAVVDLALANLFKEKSVDSLENIFQNNGIVDEVLSFFEDLLSKLDALIDDEPELLNCINMIEEFQEYLEDELLFRRDIP